MNNKEIKLSPTQKYNLLLAKTLWFSTAMCSVGWSRFQNNFYLQNGLSSGEIGKLKSIGLILKIFGEPFWSMIADLTDQKAILGLCMIMQIMTMEILRVVKPLTYNTIFLVKVLRTTTAPSSTLTTTASFKLTEGTKEGYGQQRMFGSLAWGFGAFFVGFLIDNYGMNALFYYTYIFNIISFCFVVYGLPSTRHKYAQSPPSPRGERKRGQTANAFALDNENDADESDSLIEENQMPYNSVTGGSPVQRELHQQQHQLPAFSKESSTSSVKARSQPQQQLQQQQQLQLQQLQYQQQQQKEHVTNVKEPWQLNTYFRELGMFLSYLPSRFLLLNAFLYGVVMTVPDTFFFISLERDFKATRTFSGLCASAQIVSSIPLFWYSEALITKYGHVRLMLFAESMCIIRLLAYAGLMPEVPNVIYIIPLIQIFHGVNFALFWATIIDAIHKLAPKDLATSCIATLNVTYFTLAGVVGNVMWGMIYDRYSNVSVVYWGSACFLFVTILLFRMCAGTIKSGLADGVFGEGFLQYQEKLSTKSKFSSSSSSSQLDQQLQQEDQEASKSQRNV